MVSEHIERIRGDLSQKIEEVALALNRTLRNVGGKLQEDGVQSEVELGFSFDVSAGGGLIIKTEGKAGISLKLKAKFPGKASA